jgi:glycosyltransferase involved in cell wall biosynthesis
MDRGAACAAVIPCFNEAAAISEVVTGVRVHLGAVLVVDDGSTDRTAAAASAAGAEVLRHERNLGKGAALQSGLRHALEHGFEWALTLDGDGQHSPEDIPAFFCRAEQATADLVVGNRMHDAGRMPRLRRAVNRWMSRQLSAAAGLSLPDSQCGFRLIRLRAWRMVPLETVRFEIESEMLLGFARGGYRIEFVPIRLLYKNEQSKIHPLRDTIRWFGWWRLARRGIPAATSERTPERQRLPVACK